jgi:hypothetical protein
MNSSPKEEHRPVSDKTNLGVRILAAALMLGVLGDALLRAGPWGINASLWVTALAATIVAVDWPQRALAGGGR